MAVTREEVENKVKEILIKALKIQDESKIIGDAKFVDDLGADSLDQIDFIMEVEDEYNIEIPDEAVEKILTVNDSITYIVDKLNESDQN